MGKKDVVPSPQLALTALHNLHAGCSRCQCSLLCSSHANDAMFGLQAGASLGGDVAKNAPDAGDVKNAGANVADKVRARIWQTL